MDDGAFFLHAVAENLKLTRHGSQFGRRRMLILCTVQPFVHPRSHADSNSLSRSTSESSESPDLPAQADDATITTHYNGQWVHLIT